MKNIQHIFEYIFLATISKMLRFLPRRGVLFLGARAGDFIYYCVPIRKKITIGHIRDAFPEKTEKEIKGICREAYRNLATNGLEHLCLAFLSHEALQKILIVDNEEVMNEGFARGKGIIFVGGHFGNWEYMGGAVSSMGYPVSYIVAELANPYVDRMVNEHRKKTGVGIFTKDVSVRAMMKTLRSNGSLAMLMDQDAGRNGIFVDFFGKLCSTPRGPALFALKTGAAVIFVSSIRRTDGTLHAVFENVAINYEKGTTEENVFDITQRCTTLLEKYVRDNPGHWFWMHRRWKTRPPVSEDQ